MATNQQSEVYGGSGGKAFDDLEHHPTIVGIRGLIVRSGNSVDSIQAIYQLKDGSTVVGPRHGGVGGSEKRFTLDEGELLVRMEGKTSGVLVDQLTFYSNRGRQYGPYGRSRTMPFETEGTELTSFFGRCGKLVDAIGVRLTRSTPQGSSLEERKTRRTIICERESSATIDPEDGTLKRNHSDLVLIPNTTKAQLSATTKTCLADQNDQYQVKNPNYTKTRSGRVSKPPERFTNVK